MAAYRRVYDSRHLQADCQEPGSAPEPYARQSSMGYTFTFFGNEYECADPAHPLHKHTNNFPTVSLD